ncbi:hypothetical protein FKM82_009435 [Ascaphus truei]
MVQSGAGLQPICRRLLNAGGLCPFFFRSDWRGFETLILQEAVGDGGFLFGSAAAEIPAADRLRQRFQRWIGCGGGSSGESAVVEVPVGYRLWRKFRGGSATAEVPAADWLWLRFQRRIDCGGGSSSGSAAAEVPAADRLQRRACVQLNACSHLVAEKRLQSNVPFRSLF